MPAPWNFKEIFIRGFDHQMFEVDWFAKDLSKCPVEFDSVKGLVNLFHASQSSTERTHIALQMILLQDDRLLFEELVFTSYLKSVLLWMNVLVPLFKPKLDSREDPDWYQNASLIGPLFEKCFLAITDSGNVRSLARRSYQILDSLTHHHDSKHQLGAIRCIKHLIYTCPKDELHRAALHEGLFLLIKDLLCFAVREQAMSLAIELVQVCAPSDTWRIDKLDELLFLSMPQCLTETGKELRSRIRFMAEIVRAEGDHVTRFLSQFINTIEKVVKDNPPHMHQWLEPLVNALIDSCMPRIKDVYKDRLLDIMDQSNKMPKLETNVVEDDLVNDASRAKDWTLEPRLRIKDIF